MGDASRLQQVVLNLVSNAVKFTAQGSVSLTVREESGMVRVNIADTGLSVPAAEQKAIFDEFHQSRRTIERGYGGLGIGLSICRQLIELHGGTIGVHSSGEENSGSTFYFSLPAIAETSTQTVLEPSQTVLILAEQDDPNQSKHCHKMARHLEEQGFQVEVLSISQSPDWLDKIQRTPKGAVVIDFHLAEHSGEIIETLKKNPHTQEIPIIFYSLQEKQNSGSVLALDYLAKPVASAKLAQILERYQFPVPETKESPSILIVDDDPAILDLHACLVRENLPKYRVECASNGHEALVMMQTHPPALLLLDLMMPGMDGMTVLKHMRADKRLQATPVIILTAQRLDEAEMASLNESVTAVLSKGVFTELETVAHLAQALARNKKLGSETQRLVRKVMAYIHQRFTQALNRQELARYAGVSERHLNRCFLQETGMTPLTYLSRYRIQQAKLMLEQDQHSITEIMGLVGFSDSSHFTHAFRREVGMSPSAYKKMRRG